MSLPDPVPEITQLLTAWRAGDPSALERLTPHVYEELHRTARAYLAAERAGHILQPTALVNEAFLNLMQWQPDQWQNRAHFFGVSSTLMRRILVKFARERDSAKRGGRLLRVSLSEANEIEEAKDADLMALDDALFELEKLDPRQVRVIELRYFGGLTLEESAEMMEVSESTVRRDFRMARAWLRQRLAA